MKRDIEIVSKLTFAAIIALIIISIITIFWIIQPYCCGDITIPARCICPSDIGYCECALP